MEFREETVGRLHAYHYPQKGEAAYTLLIIPGTGGHGGQYDVFCQLHRTRGADIYSIDLPGHGKSYGERGSYTQEECMERLIEVAQELKRSSSRPLIVLGSSMGSGYALNLMNACEHVDGCVSMGVAMWSAKLYDQQRKAYSSEGVQFVVKQFGDAIKLHIFDWLKLEENYGDPTIARERFNDHFQLKTFTFPSLCSLLSYQPPVPISQTRKPFMMAAGELDPYAPAERVAAIFGEIGGPKELYIEPKGGHQLMLFHTQAFSSRITEWFARHFGPRR
jgi:pimeloyl-ACP methyl ester carboxylesterase